MALRSGEDAGAAALADGRQIEYRVDAYGRRLAKLVDGTVVRKWRYAGGLLPVAELDTSDNLISVFNGGFMVRDGKTYRIITDHLGSPRLVVDASMGEVAQQLTYDVWGKVTEDTNPGFQPFGFAREFHDPDTGLVRFGARDYDPLAGRWTAKDPIRFGGGTTNLYEPFHNNPVNFVDPEGLFVISPPTAALGTASTIAIIIRLAETYPGNGDPCPPKGYIGVDADSDTARREAIERIKKADGRGFTIDASFFTKAQFEYLDGQVLVEDNKLVVNIVEIWKEEGTSGNGMKMFQELLDFAIDAGLDSVSVRGKLGTADSRGLVEKLGNLPGFSVTQTPGGMHIITFTL